MAAQKTLVVASVNGHKIAEISAIAGSFGYEVVSRAQAGAPDLEVEENGESFEENSLIKARAVFDMLGGTVAVVADDSGLEVDALGGAPGIYSARFAGLEAPGFYAAGADGDLADFMEADKWEGTEYGRRSRQDRANNAKLLRLLERVPARLRTARFVSVITCLRPGGTPLVCRGEVEGLVGFAPEGAAGFGYDPLFIPSGYDRSFGLFAPEDKNGISHRGRALAALAEKLGEGALP
jgi:XTP/dITP diphosphohydrolase